VSIFAAWYDRGGAVPSASTAPHATTRRQTMGESPPRKFLATDRAPSLTLRTLCSVQGPDLGFPMRETAAIRLCARWRCGGCSRTAIGGRQPMPKRAVESARPASRSSATLVGDLPLNSRRDEINRMLESTRRASRTTVLRRFPIVRTERRRRESAGRTSPWPPHGETATRGAAAVRWIGLSEATMLVNPKSYLVRARREGWALGGFNVFNLESARARHRRGGGWPAPLLVQTSEGPVKHAGLNNLVAIVRELAGQDEVAVALHLDHGRARASRGPRSTPLHVRDDRRLP